MTIPFNLSKEHRNDMISSIQDYFLKERQEEIGNVEAGYMLDFFSKKLAPSFYNQGVKDSHQFISEKLEDLFEIEKTN